MHHFIGRFNREQGKTIEAITPEALNSLENFHWPGNIRELENAIEHSFIVETSNQLTFFSLPEYIRKTSRKKPSVLRTETPFQRVEMMDWEKRKEDFEKEFIVQALRNCRGKINLTAEQSNIPKNTLLRKIKKYNLNPRDYGASDGDFE